MFYKIVMSISWLSLNIYIGFKIIKSETFSVFYNSNFDTIVDLVELVFKSMEICSFFFNKIDISITYYFIILIYKSIYYYFFNGFVNIINDFYNYSNTQSYLSFLHWTQTYTKAAPLPLTQEQIYAIYDQEHHKYTISHYNNLQELNRCYYRFIDLSQFTYNKSIQCTYYISDNINDYKNILLNSTSEIVATYNNNYDIIRNSYNYNCIQQLNYSKTISRKNMYIYDTSYKIYNSVNYFSHEYIDIITHRINNFCDLKELYNLQNYNFNNCFDESYSLINYNNNRIDSFYSCYSYSQAMLLDYEKFINTRYYDFNNNNYTKIIDVIRIQKYSYNNYSYVNYANYDNIFIYNNL